MEDKNVDLRRREQNSGYQRLGRKGEKRVKGWLTAPRIQSDRIKSSVLQHSGMNIDNNNLSIGFKIGRREDFEHFQHQEMPNV